MLCDDHWFPLVILCCIAWMIRIIMCNRNRTQPPLPPGPMGLPIVGMLPFLDPQLHTYFTNLAKTYGPLMSLRLGKKTLIVVSSPMMAKQMLKDLDITFSNHDESVASREIGYGSSDLTYAPYGPQLRMLRKVTMNGMLGAAPVDAVSNLRRQVLHETVRYLQEHAACPVNIGDQMFMMVLKLIMSMLWGKTVNGEELDSEGPEFRSVLNMVFELLATPNVSDLFPGLARFDLQGLVRKMRHCTKRIGDKIEGIIAKCKEIDNNQSGDKDFLQFLLHIKDEGDTKTRITMPQIKALLSDMILGGTDTMTSTLEFAMAEIVNNPKVMRKAQGELEEVVGADNHVEESHIHQLPYLQAIMKETLRLHPVGPFLVPRRPSDSCIVEGYTIPKDSAIFFNVWAIHRDPLLWEDSLEFKPERFLNAKYDFISGNDFTYFPFGSGRRICVGMGLAQRIILYSLASLLHYFDWKLPQGVEKVNISDKFALTLKNATPVVLIPLPRASYVRN